ncbi:MAG: hypothetical protein GQF41_0497 [Candidatus Rifleibacterium amylolyticum]|nr:MAG: hypothetical protein GQF41_0497 [Candidatus Rifleibacterium amylolyticum]
MKPAESIDKINADLPKAPPFSLRRIFKGASIYAFGEVLVGASGFFLIPLYTRVLTPEDYGIMGYLQVFLQIATVIVAFGFHGAQTRYYYENVTDENAVGRFLFTINLVPLAAGFLLILPLSVAGYYGTWTFGSSNIPFSPFMILTLWTVILQVIANNATNYYKAKQNFFVAAILQVTRFLSITGFSLLFVLGYDMGALGRVSGLFVGMALFLVFSFSVYARNFVWKPSLGALKYAAAFGAPIVIHLLSSTIHTAIDRVMLERYVSLADLGIYTLSMTVGHALGMFVSSFNQAFQPGYFQLMSSNRKDKELQIIRTFKLFLIIMTAISSIGIILGGPFLKVFAGPRFEATIWVFPWVILSVFMGSFYFFFVSPVFFFKKTKFLPLITGLSAVVNVFLNLLLIPEWGITGAAVATVISHVVQSLSSLWVGNSIYSMQWPYGLMAIAISIVCLSLYFTM